MPLIGAEWWVSSVEEACKLRWRQVDISRVTAVHARRSKGALTAGERNGDAASFNEPGGLGSG